MAKQIRVALVTHSGGAHVTAYLTALAQTKSCGGVILVDPDGRWTREARTRLGDKLVSIHRTLKPALATDRPAMTLVSMEAKLAPPLIDQALEAGCHVFAEKPACVRLADFESLVTKADAKHLHLMLALANRVNPEIAKARQLIATGVLGRIYGLDMHLVADQTRLTRKTYQDQWFAHKSRAGGGHLIWLGIHWLDLAMFVTGSAIRQVGGLTGNVGGQPIDIEDSAVATLRFQNGALGTLHSAYYLDKGYHSGIKIWASDGWLELSPGEERPLRWYTNRDSKSHEWDGSKQPRGYSPFVDAAVRACADGSDPPINNADSLRALKTVHAIYASATSGRSYEVR